MTNVKSVTLPFFLWDFVNYLIHTFGLNECEAADLSDQAQHMIDARMNRDQVVEGLWVRADVLLNNGSKLQPIWDKIQQLKP